MNLQYAVLQNLLKYSKNWRIIQILGLNAEVSH